MQLRRALLWLLGTALGVSLLGSCCGSPSHSLCYFYRQLPESSQRLPQSFITGYLDDQPIARYDSLTRKMEPLVPWVEEVEKERFQFLEWMFGGEMKNLPKLSRNAGGLHTWQLVVGCELREDGSKGGFLHYGYNGRDFISFDKETLRWVTAQPQAQKIKEMWENHPRWSQENKDFLEETCIEWLQRYLSYQKEAPQRIEPPVGKVTWKVVGESLEILTCQAFGFYPKEIQATWMRDGELWMYETLRGNVAPNSDGTYYVWLSTEINSNERGHFWCHLEHISLQEPLVLAFRDERATVWWITMGIVAAIILTHQILFLSCWRWRCRKKQHQEETCLNEVSLEMLPSSPSAEDGIQS